MRRNTVLVLTLFTGLAAVALLPTEEADAIPAFARKYRFSCSTCHAPFPRLKPFGDEFAGRGFRLEDPAQEPTRATYDTGDPMLALSRDLPLAVRLDFHSSWKQEATAEADFEWPWAFKLLSGGPVSPRVSYYFYAIIEKGEPIKLEDTYLQFSSPFGLPLDMIVGQFQVCDPVAKRELRLEREDYEIFKARVGDSRVNLAYDRGVLLAGTLPGDVDAILQVVNGNGIDEAEGDEFDSDTPKNVALRLARQFGPVRLGVLGYRGRTETDAAENVTTYLGPDLVADLGERWQLSACYLQRRDDDPFFTGDAALDVETDGGFAELLFFPQGQDGRWTLAALYNTITSDDPAAEYESVALSSNLLLARNAKLLFEVARDLQHDATRVTIGAVTAF